MAAVSTVDAMFTEVVCFLMVEDKWGTEKDVPRERKVNARSKVLSKRQDNWIIPLDSSTNFISASLSISLYS